LSQLYIEIILLITLKLQFRGGVNGIESRAHQSRGVGGVAPSGKIFRKNIIEGTMVNFTKKHLLPLLRVKFSKYFKRGERQK
jgi:hypothetical protein